MRLEKLEDGKCFIRKAIPSDLDVVNGLANSHKNELGFIRKVTISNSINNQELLVAEINGLIKGFVRFHHRRDLQTTLYDIVVLSDHRRKGIGKTLIDSLSTEASELGKYFIVLKCPSELSANYFYEHIGFVRWRDEPGKRRSLIIWRIQLKP